ncbi:unnamed protein product [Callosobruchus maculatus]|uniref:Uncharacterized protein n=1 Tax=Callosobruchus maculatus TaxID=64391 RepID=A0A653CZY1_CALMS|nr:unnamed protein product [Callosobruchus maculatus]
MLAVKEAIKIEVGEVKIKTETAKVESELLFGIEQTRGSTIKYADTDETVVNRSKEGRIVQNWKNNLEMQVTKAELGEDANYEELKIESEELIIKDENGDLNDANGDIDVNR